LRIEIEIGGLAASVGAGDAVEIIEQQNVYSDLMKLLN
jgi:hypothetical protein